LFVRTQSNGDRTYLLIVENERVEGRIKQRVLHRLGRLDELRASGELDGLLASQWSGSGAASRSGKYASWPTAA
jgi:hypothetical protein